MLCEDFLANQTCRAGASLSMQYNVANTWFPSWFPLLKNKKTIFLLTAKVKQGGWALLLQVISSHATITAAFLHKQDTGACMWHYKTNGIWSAQNFWRPATGGIMLCVFAISKNTRCAPWYLWCVSLAPHLHTQRFKFYWAEMRLDVYFFEKEKDSRELGRGSAEGNRLLFLNSLESFARETFHCSGRCWNILSQSVCTKTWAPTNPRMLKITGPW